MTDENQDRNGTVQRVRRFLRQLDRGDASVEDAGRIRDELCELVSRVERVNEMYPEREGPELSSDVQELLQEIDRNKLVDRFPFIKQAASFL